MPGVFSYNLQRKPGRLAFATALGNGPAAATPKKLKGELTNAKRQQQQEVKLPAGKTYVIDMHSKQFDTFLKLHDANGKLVAENDDIDYKNKKLNSQITFTPKKGGAYRLLADSYGQTGRGRYEIVIREFKSGNESHCGAILFPR